MTVISAIAWQQSTLTRLAALGTLSRDAGEGGPSPQGWVGEGYRLSAVTGQAWTLSHG